MPPSRESCQALAALYNLKGEVAERLSDIGSAVLRLLDLRIKTRFGLIDILDSVGSEVIAAVGAVSSQVAENVLGDISKMASSMLERIFSSLLKIVLAFPTSIFSLVAIPHDAAKNATKRERTYLTRAEKNLRVILYIILKWTKGKSGSDYYNQMIEALPFIRRAIALCEDLILGLDGEPIRPGEAENNSVFKEGIYNKVRANLNAAIGISRPTSIIEQKLEINKRLENDKEKRYQSKADAINAEYSRRRKSIAEWYRDEISKVVPNASDTAPNRLVDALKEQKVRLEYAERLENLKVWKQESLALANLDAEAEALINKDTWIGAITDTSEKFVLDMSTLTEELFDMLENIKNAYTQNKASQLYCNNIYDMRNIITRIIKEMISYMRSSGNAVGEALSAVISEAQSLMEVAESTYTGATNPGLEFPASNLATSLTIGHGTLQAADAILDSAVTDSLIDIINSDDILQAENEEFNEFITELALIPDWDGRTGVWSVDMLNGATSPYIQLIADITEMLEKVPGLSVTDRDSDRRRVQSLINGVRKDFTVLRRHNSRVANTLSSYTPYVGSEAGDLMKILASAGLLNSFASAMSLATLTADIASAYNDYFGDGWPSYDKCTADDAYPELFTGEKVLKGMTNNNLNMPDPKLQNESQAEFERDSKDRKIPELRDEAKHTDYSKIGDKEESNVLGYPGQDASTLP